MDDPASRSPPHDSTTRRSALRALSGVGLAALTGMAGCIGSESPPAGTEETRTDGTVDSTTGNSTTGGTNTADGEVPSFAAWTYETGHEALGTLSLGRTGDGPAVYVGSDVADSGSGGSRSDDDHALHALSLRDGSERWRASLPAPVRSPPTYAGRDDASRLVFPIGPQSLHGENAAVRALDAASGESAWEFDTEERRFVYPLSATEDAVFIGRRDDQLGRRGEYVYALDAGDGSERWRVESGDADREGSRAVLNTLFVQSHGRFRALDPATGEERWRVEDDRSIEGPAVGGQGKRVFLGYDDAIRALRIDDGSEVWRREVDFTVSAITRPNAGASTTVYVGDYDGRLLALSPLDGETRWTLSVDRDQFYPVVERTSERLFVGGADVYALDPVSGEEEWSFTHDGPGTLGVQASTTAFAVDGRGNTIYALDPASGEERWQFDPGADLVGPVTAGDVAFVGVGNVVYALDGSESP